MTQRRTDLDALRGFAMLLGIDLHASLSFFAFPWPVHDTRRSDLLPLFLVGVHGFRMPLFFLLSGYFTMLVYRRRGLESLLEQRFTRIFLPLVIAAATIVPLDTQLGRRWKLLLPAAAVLLVAGIATMNDRPLVMVAQLLVRQWPLPAEVKFLLILALVTPLLLASYRWCVRSTVIGSLLNGPRPFPTDGPGRQ